VQGGITGFVYTDLDGRYAFDGMPVGSFTVRGSSGSVSGTGVAGVELTGLNIVVETRPPAEFGTVHGRVVNPDGSPARGVIVAGDVSSFIIENGVVTGADGTFEMGGLEIGRPLSLGAITRDRLRTGHASFQIDPVTHLANGVVITLSGIGTAEFTVQDADGNALSGIEVTLVSAGGPLTLGACSNPCGCHATISGPTGKVRFEDLPLGQVPARST
jgi:hypothetical protein